jgi:glycosyltransferase involved in cell wall biosynthesis
MCEKMAEQPLVSIIIPVYNVEPYVAQCVDSVLAQTYPNLQVILVDDGSTDNSGKICDEYAKRDGRVRVFHTKNGGVSSARNHGLKHALGEYVLMVDSDDWIKLDAVNRMVVVAKHSDADIVASSFSAEWLDRSERQKGLSDCEEKLSKVDALYALICDRRISNAPWAKLYKRGLFQGIQYPVGRVFEDVATTWKLVEASNVVSIIPDNLFHYRIRGNGISRAFSAKNIVDYWLAYIERYNALSEKYDNLQEGLMGGCAIAITSAWRRLYPVPADDKRRLASQITDMQIFARKHCKEVLAGRESAMVKGVFVLCRFANPVVWALLYAMGEMYDYVTTRRRKAMFS